MLNDSTVETAAEVKRIASLTCAKKHKSTQTRRYAHMLPWRYSMGTKEIQTDVQRDTVK